VYDAIEQFAACGPMSQNSFNDETCWKPIILETVPDLSKPAAHSGRCDLSFVETTAPPLDPTPFNDIVHSCRKLIFAPDLTLGGRSRATIRRQTKLFDGSLEIVVNVIAGLIV
jgi:hypothetical protein